VLAQIKGVITGLDDDNLIYDWVLNRNEALLVGNDGETNHPDQMDLSLEELVKSGFNGFYSVYSGNDSNLVLELSDAISKEWADREFVRSGITYDLNTTTFGANIDEEMSRFTNNAISVLPDIVSKSIIIGLRDYLIENRRSDQIEASYDPMCLAYIRQALGSALDGLFEGYKDKVSGIIVKELERNFSNG
jgi:hypothetical protein